MLQIVTICNIRPDSLRTIRSLVLLQKLDDRVQTIDDEPRDEPLAILMLRCVNHGSMNDRGIHYGSLTQQQTFLTQVLPYRLGKRWETSHFPREEARICGQLRH